MWGSFINYTGLKGKVKRTVNSYSGTIASISNYSLGTGWLNSFPVQPFLLFTSFSWFITKKLQHVKLSDFIAFGIKFTLSGANVIETIKILLE